MLEHREQGTELKRQVVLFRTSHHSDLLELELTRRNIPFVKYGGLKFLEAAHIKDVLALLRVLENPRDEVSWFRVLQLIDGIGPGHRSLDHVEDRRAHGRRIAAASVSRGDAIASARCDQIRLLPSTGAGSASSSAPLARRLARESSPIVSARRCRPAPKSRGFVASSSRSSTVGTPAPPRVCRTSINSKQSPAATPVAARFLGELALDPPSSTSDLAGPPLLDEDYLILSTVHSAKGGEWDVVHVIHAADGMIPSDMSTGDAESIEEERRLFYVALTRARDMLYVYFPLRFYRRPRGQDDAHHYAQLTRFLPSSVQALFDHDPGPGHLRRRCSNGPRHVERSHPGRYIAGVALGTLIRVFHVSGASGRSLRGRACRQTDRSMLKSSTYGRRADRAHRVLDAPVPVGRSAPPRRPSTAPSRRCPPLAGRGRARAGTRRSATTARPCAAHRS